MAGNFSDDDWSDEEDFLGDESCDESVDNKKNSSDAQDSKPKTSKHILQLQQRLGTWSTLLHHMFYFTFMSILCQFMLFAGLDELKKRKATEEAEKAAKKPREDQHGPQVVVYSDPSKRKKERDLKKQQLEEQKSAAASKARNKKTHEEDAPEFNIIKAKHEVKRLTIQSLKKTSKAEAQVALAVSLGALPPKAKPVNYKELKASRKAEQERIQKLKQEEHVFVSRVKTMTKKKDPKKNKNKVAKFDAGFGKFSPALRKQISSGKKSKK